MGRTKQTARRGKPIPVTSTVDFHVSRRLSTCLSLFNSGKWKESSEEGEIWVSLDIAISTLGDHLQLEFRFCLYWNETKTPYSRLRSTFERKQSQKVLDTFLSDGSNTIASGRQSWSPLDFYEAAHVPPSDDENGLTINVPELTASLYPYQKRTLSWLLKREGVCWKNSPDGSSVGLIEDFPAPKDLDTAHTFRKTQDALGGDFYVSHVYHVATSDLTPFQQAEQHVRGGILAEEMGLGKTLEVIGLIALHRRPDGESNTVLTREGEELLATGATLIVSPSSLKEQWMSEIHQHAPHLRVKYYPGRKNVGFESEELLRKDLAAHDIIVTTYSILTSELHYAIKPPERSRRQERKYERPASPLTQMLWWRICLDEAQMIESGVTGAAAVAKVIPRVNAWGVTGTPVKNDVKDLFGLLNFLRYEPYASYAPAWKALTDSHKPLFRSLFASIALRHTKQLVRHEIAVPPQKRFVITLPFTAVEEQYYGEMFRNMTRNCGLDMAGNPSSNDWKLEQYETEMRAWLNRLRQATLHPEIVQRRGNGRKVGPMRTVDEVLDAMLEQGDNDIRTEQRAYFQARLLRGQMLENGPRVKEALEIWEKVKKDASALVSECREEAEDALKELKCSGSNQDSIVDFPSDEDDNEETDDLSGVGRVGEARTRLRHALEILHKATFFCANAFFQIKSNSELTEPESDDHKKLQQLEDSEYSKAQEIRREILSESHAKATSLVNKLGRQAQSQTFVDIPELAVNLNKGLESAGAIEKLEELYGVLNEQANVIDEWREAVIKLLSQPLIDEEAEVENTGEEFTDSTKTQEELIVYVQVLRAAVADRQDAISGLENALVKHETKVSLITAKADEGPAPEQMIALHQLRDKVRPDRDRHGSLRGAIAELRAIASRLPQDGGGRAGVEREIVVRQIRETQAHITAQTKAATALEREMDRFTSAMNARVEYYRQLQAVSDSVAPYEGPNNQQAIDSCKVNEDQARQKFDAARAKHRYLLNLKEAGTQSNEPRMCIICQSSFTIGVLTVCGHQFCKDCIKQWYRAHHNCPMCKRKLRLTELHDITLKPREVKLLEETTTSTTHEPKDKNVRTNGIYSQFGSEKIAQIKDIELAGLSYGSKVDSIVRHIIWLRKTDPGAKSIVFTQYRSFLGVLSAAFFRYKIGFASIDSSTGIQRFKEDPGVEIFMLHGRAQSSGLNLVNASHVFLCEPLLNTALELQAIARVDRIGQKHETTVWLYLIEGTRGNAPQGGGILGALKATEMLDSRPSLPAEILVAILDYLPVADLMQVARASRRMQEMVYDDTRWVARLKSMGCWNEAEARQRFDEAMRKRREAAERAAKGAAGGQPGAPGSHPPKPTSTMLFDATVEEERRKRQSAVPPIDGFERMTVGAPAAKDPFKDPEALLDVIKNSRSIRGHAREEYGKIYGSFAPFYFDLARAKSHTDPIVFQVFRDPERQAKMLSNLQVFAKSDWAQGWNQREERLMTMTSIFEGAVLREFEQGYEFWDVDGRMKRYAHVLHTLNGGNAATELFIQKHPIFSDREVLAVNSSDCINQTSGDEINLEPSRLFFEMLLRKVNEHAEIIGRIFANPDVVFWEFMEKVREDVIMDYITPLFDATHDRNLQWYLKAVAGTFEQGMLFFKSVVPPKDSKSNLEEKAKEMMLRVFEPHLDLYLQEELDFFTRHAESEVAEWEKKLSEQDASVESFYMSNFNRQADKKDFLSSFRKVVMMPVTVLPSFGSTSTTTKPTTPNGTSALSPQPSRPHTPSLAPNTDGNGRLSPLPAQAPTDELAAKAALMASRMEGIKTLFSIEIALNLTHKAKTSMGRASLFIQLGGQYGEEAREQCETIFVVMLRILGNRHVKVGFEKAVEHLSHYNPREVSDHNQSGVAPLVTFIELVNVGDLISQMIDVFYEQQLAGPKIADRNDFLDPAGIAKKKWEQMLDESVAAGLNKGIDVLMDEVEYLHGTTQQPTDYNPSETGGILADPGPTETALRIKELVSSHTRMLVGTTEKSMLDVFNGEVGLRLFTAVCKHLKRQRISTEGAIKLIADMNLYFEYIRTLKNQDLLAYFKALRELSQIYLIDAKHAKEMATIIADGDRFEGVFRAEEAYEFAQRRSDWYTVRKDVERAMYGMECSLM
ncbi:putative ATP-dependent helicase [Colletotrichum sp. SAR 10_65]|nr:putative ATP-dependent helicase [Colletotrichum sp. SAR 10_65]